MDYAAPRPVDPLWYREDGYWLRVSCECGHAVSKPVALWIKARRLRREMAFYELQARLRCIWCGRRAATIDVSRRI
ncbi:hypothetical protein EOD42_14605 [Rhodovarius crocodyli]|uniref:Uncharacterized protein n=1 Tax=Rhodovarius crocodyli TaxID=1979269 RepID=A0A437MFD5_9PROT|nr:hypothetical protein [Rhodovarius crocodyli]RVT96336.1 hypothetical protein EOD42_14605 [Rhodovarius crocodyli]